jgi:hypothetical protein
LEGHAPFIGKTENLQAIPVQCEHGPFSDSVFQLALTAKSKILHFHTQSGPCFLLVLDLEVLFHFVGFGKADHELAGIDVGDVGNKEDAFNKGTGRTKYAYNDKNYKK